jgi:hypothetical protein
LVRFDGIFFVIRITFTFFDCSFSVSDAHFTRRMREVATYYTRQLAILHSEHSRLTHNCTTHEAIIGIHLYRREVGLSNGLKITTKSD